MEAQAALHVTASPGMEVVQSVHTGYLWQNVWGNCTVDARFLHCRLHSGPLWTAWRTMPHMLATACTVH